MPSSTRMWRAVSEQKNDISICSLPGPLLAAAVGAAAAAHWQRVQVETACYIGTIVDSMTWRQAKYPAPASPDRPFGRPGEHTGMLLSRLSTEVNRICHKFQPSFGGANWREPEGWSCKPL